MRIMLVAPQPFFQERGTPIAVRMLAEALCEDGHTVDLLCYHEGEDIQFPGLSLFRIPDLRWIRKVPIGFSWKKLVCDVYLRRLMRKQLARQDYDVIHAIEESVYLALPLARKRSLPVIYDMDSSMADQLIEKWSVLKILSGILYASEKFAVRRSDRVLAVCQHLADRARQYDADKPVHILEDAALPESETGTETEDIRALIDDGEKLVLYVGNLEHYQGVELVLDAMAMPETQGKLQLVIIGGKDKDIQRLKQRCQDNQSQQGVHFLGPRPVNHLAGYLGQADILVSPRLKGNNTPMKVYSYLASGRPVVATDIASHTQVLNADCAMLVPVQAAAISRALVQLADDAALRERLGRNGQDLARREYSLPAFKQKLRDSYRGLSSS